MDYSESLHDEIEDFIEQTTMEAYLSEQMLRHMTAQLETSVETQYLIKLLFYQLKGCQLLPCQ